MTNLIKKYKIASILGSGNQYMPWIHVEDLASIFLKTIRESEIEGVYNAVAPQHISNKEFNLALKEIANEPKLKIVKTPSFLLRIIFGKMAALVLKGSRVSSDKLIDTGFEFKYPSIEFAMEDLLYRVTP